MSEGRPLPIDQLNDALIRLYVLEEAGRVTPDPYQLVDFHEAYVQTYNHLQDQLEQEGDAAAYLPELKRRHASLVEIGEMALKAHASEDLRSDVMTSQGILYQIQKVLEDKYDQSKPIQFQQCTKCPSDLMYAARYERLSPEDWDLELCCPNCGEVEVSPDCSTDAVLALFKYHTEVERRMRRESGPSEDTGPTTH